MLLLTPIISSTTIRFMMTITLKEYLKENSQTKAAVLIGCTQGAIHQMVLNDRDIRLEFTKGGKFKRAYEVKHVGKIA